MIKIIDAAYALFLHNSQEYTDVNSAQLAWMLDEDLQQYWVSKVHVVLKSLGLMT